MNGLTEDPARRQRQIANRSMFTGTCLLQFRTTINSSAARYARVKFTSGFANLFVEFLIALLENGPKSLQECLLIAKQLLKMLTCQKKCNKMLLTVLHKPLISSTLKRTLQLTSRKSSTRNTIQLGIASWEGTSVVM